MFAPMIIKTLIVDDEPLARQRIENLLQKRLEFTTIGSCPNGQTALQTIHAQQPDLVFLDIQMKGMTGFDVLEQLEPHGIPPLVIFITAYDKYALKAFDFFAFDYLLKPFKDDRFFQSLDRAYKQIQTNRPDLFLGKLRQLLGHVTEEKMPITSPDLIPIKQAKKVCLIEPGSIQYILGAGYYIEIYTLEKRYLIRETLQDFYLKLPSNQFQRVHRSAIINLDRMEVLNNGGGEWSVLMKDGRNIRVSKGYKPELLRRLGLARDQN